MEVGHVAAGILLDPEDNVATMLEDLEAGGEVQVRDRSGAVVERVTALDSINRGHKIALENIDEGGLVRKYGEAIGRATTPIAAGRWVHTHNVESMRGRGDLAGGDNPTGGRNPAGCCDPVARGGSAGRGGRRPCCGS